jgi:hypothetical protein
MSSKKTKFIVIPLSILVILIVTAIFFISPISKYLVEKYDEEYTGRQITMDWAYVNPLTGYVHFENVKVHELKSDSLFLTCDGLSLNFSMLKLFSKTYEINELTLDNPKVFIVQNLTTFNFDDLIEKFSSTSDTTTPPVHFNLLEVKINEGEFHYTEATIPVHYFIKEMHFESPGMRWDSDTIVGSFSFLSGIGKGDMKGAFKINIEKMDYGFSATAHQFDLSIIEQYLKDMSNYGSLKANFDADVKAGGNFKDGSDINLSGTVAINDFHFGKNIQEDYASWEKVVLKINQLNPKNKIYLFDSIMVKRPFFKYEKYDYLDNVERIFGKGGSNVKAANADDEKFNLIIEIADYVKILSKNFFKSSYKINRLVIENANIQYVDYSQSERFFMGLDPLNFIADSIEKNNDRVRALITSNIEPYGKVFIQLSINPKDENDFDLNCKLEKIPASLFNPYLITYTSYPLDRGTLQFHAKWKVRNGIIQSDNHLVLIDPRVTKKIKNDDTQWLPLPLIMAFVRERGNVIDYTIPITGNLKDPKFNVWDVVIDLVKNIFIKPPSTPYRMVVKGTEEEIEKTLSVKWQMRQAELRQNQNQFIEKIADFLKNNPEVKISVTPVMYTEKEKEYILFYEAKKKYYLKIHQEKKSAFSEADSLAVEKMSVKDAAFIAHLNHHSKDSMLFTIQQKCASYVSQNFIYTKLLELETLRKLNFMEPFQANGTTRQLVFHAISNATPYN